MVLHEGPDNCRIMKGKCRYSFILFPSMKVCRDLFLLFSDSPRVNLWVSPWVQESQEKVLCAAKHKAPRQLPRGQGGTQGSFSFSYHHSQSIPDVWFWVSNLILRGFGLFSGNKASCSILVTHYLISTMMYEQPHKYNDAQLQYKHSHC